MKPPDRVKIDLVGQWFAKAEEDLVTARILLSSASSPGGGIAFHAQQVAEKYLKGYLVWRQIIFPKTHDIGVLLDLVSTEDEGLATELNAAVILSNYAVFNRYPGDIPQIGRAEAERAFALAEKSKALILEAMKDFPGLS